MTLISPAHSQDAGEQPAFWTTADDDLLKRLGSRHEGLSTDEANTSLRIHGPNLAVVSVHRSLLVKFVKRLAEPLIAILLIAAVVSGATGDWQSFLVILIVVLFSILLDVTQERHAEATVEALRRSVAVTATLRRDGKTIELPVADIAPGDIVELKAGEFVPADGVVLVSNGLLANEAVLTGEPYFAQKRPGPCAGPLVTDAFNALFGGTSIVGGQGLMLVVATGAATRFGAISASIQTQSPPTAFERGIHALGMLILRLTGFLVLFVLLTQITAHGLSLESFLFAVALAVGLTPELLPMIMTVTLARGAMRMASLKVVVKRLSAIHDLGAMDVLCTDKTGTLTQARISHIRSFRSDGAESARVTLLARINSRFASGMASNLDDAMLAGDAPAEEAEWTRLDDLPFDFERRRASVLARHGVAVEMITKGAPEAVLALCGQVEGADGAVTALGHDERARIEAQFAENGAQGLRLLGVARRPMPADCLHLQPGDEADLIFVGCAAFLDPPKDSATQAVAHLTELGVRVKVISGDAGPVVQHLVGTLHLATRGMMSGEEIAKLTDAALAVRVERTDLYVRVSPDQKSRIVRALRMRGHTVGFIGDGINDAPAIHGADVGLSVAGAAEVAREAADIILLENDLAVLSNGVVEGRRTYANVMKYVRMGTSSNFGNMLSMAIASLLLPFLPLAPLQILLNNLIYDFSEIGIPFDTADEDMLARPQVWDMRAVLRFTLIMGPLSSLFDLATFYLLYAVFHAEPATFRTAWFVESIATQVLVIFIIRTSKPLWRSRPHWVPTATALGALALALVLALSPLGHFAGFTAAPPSVLAAIAVVSLAYLLAAEGLKKIAMKPMRARRHRLNHRQMAD